MPEIVKKKIQNKKPVKKKIQKKKTIISMKKETKSTEQLLIENFVALQKVMANLSSRFDELSNKISSLLNLFEVSAQALAKRNFDLGNNNQELIRKIDNIAQQNKIIARGVSLLHEDRAMQEPLQQSSTPQRAFTQSRMANQPIQRPIPSSQRRFPMPSEERGLTRSISNQNNSLPPHREIRKAIENQE